MTQSLWAMKLFLSSWAAALPYATAPVNPLRDQNEVHTLDCRLRGNDGPYSAAMRLLDPSRVTDPVG